MIRNILEPLVCEKFKTDAHYREGHLRVLNALPNRKVLGMHSPDIKGIAKKLTYESGEELISAFEVVAPSELCYEEMAVWGFMINFMKCPAERKFKMLERFVPIMDNWGICDSYVSHAKWMKKVSSEKLLSWIDKWFHSHHEFEVRFAVIVSMCYLLESNLNKIFARLDNLDFGKIVSEYRSVKMRPKEIQAGCVLGPGPYYVNMGVAWLLATALAKYPDETRTYVRTCNLPQDVLRLYVRKARESLRTRDISPF